MNNKVALVINARFSIKKSLHTFLEGFFDVNHKRGYFQKLMLSSLSKMFFFSLKLL
jgi:hypothetical protein